LTVIAAAASREFLPVDRSKGLFAMRLASPRTNSFGA
jgi:hypothetical protein